MRISIGHTAVKIGVCIVGLCLFGSAHAATTELGKNPTPPTIKSANNYALDISWEWEEAKYLSRLTIAHTNTGKYYTSEAELRNVLVGPEHTSCSIAMSDFDWGSTAPYKVETFGGEGCDIYAFTPSLDKSRVEIFFKDMEQIHGETVVAMLSADSDRPGWSWGSEYSNFFHVGKSEPTPVSAVRRGKGLFITYPTAKIKEFYIAFSREKVQYTRAEGIFEGQYRRMEQPFQYCYFPMNKNQRSIIDKNFEECSFSLDWSNSAGVLLTYKDWNPEGRTVFMGYVLEDGTYAPYGDAVYFPQEAPVPNEVIDVVEPENVQHFTDYRQMRTMYQRAIAYVSAERGIVQGYPDGTFRPASYINRAEFTKILVGAVRSAELQNYRQQNGTGKANCFSDVRGAEWYGDFVCYAWKANILRGYPDGSFRPGAYINKAEALKILMEAYAVAPAFSANSSGSWYEPYQTVAQQKGLLNTVTFSPAAYLTREEMAEWIYQFEQQ